MVRLTQFYQQCILCFQQAKTSSASLTVNISAIDRMALDNQLQTCISGSAPVKGYFQGRRPIYFNSLEEIKILGQGQLSVFSISYS